MTKTTAATLIATRTAFNPALSRMPTTSTVVTRADDQERGQVDEGSRRDQSPELGVVLDDGTGEGRGQTQAGRAQEVLEVARPPGSHRSRGHRVFEHQVPADDPGGKLPQGGVGVGVGRARHRGHGGELRVAQRGEDAHHPRHHVREHEGGARRLPCDHARAHEDSRPDDGPHPEARELDGAQHAAQTVVAGLLEQAGERLPGKERAHPWSDLLPVGRRGPSGRPPFGLRADRHRSA